WRDVRLTRRGGSIVSCVARICVCTAVSVVIAFYSFFFLNATATTEIYTLSLHDALPIYLRRLRPCGSPTGFGSLRLPWRDGRCRSEEHTSELQSPCNLVCRLLLEKKNSRPRVYSAPRSYASRLARHGRSISPVRPIPHPY